MKKKKKLIIDADYLLSPEIKQLQPSERYLLIVLASMSHKGEPFPYRTKYGTYDLSNGQLVLFKAKLAQQVEVSRSTLDRQLINLIKAGFLRLKKASDNDRMGHIATIKDIDQITHYSYHEDFEQEEVNLDDFIEDYEPESVLVSQNDTQNKIEYIENTEKNTERIQEEENRITKEPRSAMSDKVVPSSFFDLIDFQNYLMEDVYPDRIIHKPQNMVKGVMDIISENEIENVKRSLFAYITEFKETHEEKEYMFVLGLINFLKKEYMNYKDREIDKTAYILCEIKYKREKEIA